MSEKLTVAPPIVRAPAPRRPVMRGEFPGTVTAVESTDGDGLPLTVRVGVGSDTRVAYVPHNARAVAVGDTVVTRVQGGSAEVESIRTRRSVPTYSFTGAASNTRAANTAPPSAVSGSVGTVGTTVDSTDPGTVSLSGVTWDSDRFNSTHVLRLYAVIQTVNAWGEIIEDLRALCVGPSGSTGLKAALNNASTVVTGVQTATNTQSTVLGEVRGVLNTNIRTDHKALGNTQ